MIFISKPKEVTREEIKRQFRDRDLRYSHVILRRDHDHIEIDVDTEMPIERFLEALEELEIEVVEVSYPEASEPDNPLEEAIELFKKGRYWEVHERLERIWKETGDPFLRGMILLTIPYVKQQMGQYDRVLEGVKRFLKFVEDTDDNRLRCIAEKLERAYKNGWLKRVEIEDCLRIKP